MVAGWSVLKWSTSIFHAVLPNAFTSYAFAEVIFVSRFAFHGLSGRTEMLDNKTTVEHTSVNESDTKCVFAG